MDRHSCETLDWFFNSMKPIEAAYTDPEFSFVIHQGKDGPTLVAAKLVLAPLAIDTQERIVETGQFYAYSGRLSNIAVTPRALLDKMLGGTITTGKIEFQLSNQSTHGTSPRLFRSTSPEHDKQQQIYELVGFDLGRHYHHAEDSDWLLRSSKIPYSNLDDLLSDFGLSGRKSQLHVIALPPILVDATSTISGEVGSLRIRMTKSLAKENASIGVVIRTQTKVNSRLHINGNEFDWHDEPNSLEVIAGTKNIPVPKASIAHCFANYNQTSYHHYWVGDPNALQNPLRTLFESFDPNLEVTRNLLNASPKRGSSGDYECSVSWILWMMGFSPLYLGGSKKLSDGPDLIAVSPRRQLHRS